MCRIIYGVSGEGSGHSSRAREMVRHLQEQGHEVKIVSYDRGYRNLSPDFDCLQVEGLRIISRNNRVSALGTVWDNLRRGPAAWRRLADLRALFTSFRPDCVITDFEPSTAWLARTYKLPLISLDNQHRMRYMKFEVPGWLRFEQWQTRAIIRFMIPDPDVALATTFFRGEVTNSRTFLFAPILRREVCALQPHRSNFHLVYLTGRFDSLIDTLKQFPAQKFVVYGCQRHGSEANLEYREFSTDGFLQDLAACQSVIATAGFTLISEAIYLQKPYLAFPMHGQFEQQLNALCLEQLGVGMAAKLADPESLSAFFQRLPAFAAKLQQQNGQETHLLQCGNNEIKAMLDSLLQDNLSLLKRLCREPI
ncbi:MAG: MJ1255/VC2487 family glycosyltransferase [Pseudomonadota bacterium]